MNSQNPKTLFIGRYVSAQCWYRCALPAIQMENADWIGLHPIEEEFSETYLGALLGGSVSEYPKFTEYDMIVIQQPRGEPLRKWIEDIQSKGVKVVYENDDFLHGIWKIPDHQYKASYSKKHMKEFEICMKQCDAQISSTEFLANEYKKYNSNQFVCKNYLDTLRYDVGIPEREGITIGWSGGTGHDKAIGPWLQVIFEVMARNPEMSFISTGMNYAAALEEHLPGRTKFIPWTPVECYPYMLTNFDIVICPSHDSKYFKSKSDLRWLEASAVGIPTISEPPTYKDSAHTVSVNSVKEFEEELEDAIYDRDIYKEMGNDAKAYVQEHRDISVGIKDWELVQKSIL